MSCKDSSLVTWFRWPTNRLGISHLGGGVDNANAVAGGHSAAKGGCQGHQQQEFAPSWFLKVFKQLLLFCKNISPNRAQSYDSDCVLVRHCARSFQD